VALRRNMRAMNDPAFAAILEQMRNTARDDPVSRDLLALLHPVTDADVKEDPWWPFAPTGVMSHIERDEINLAQLETFAAATGRLLVRWPLPLHEADAERIPEDTLRELRAHEPATLWGYSVVDAPGLLSENYNALRMLVNGTPCLDDSLGFAGEVPDKLAEAIADGRTGVLTLDEPPDYINVRLTGGTWHGVQLDGRLRDRVRDVSLARDDGDDDGDGGGATAGPPDAIIPIPLSKGTEEVALNSLFAVQHGLPTKVRVRTHDRAVAFAVTDFKLQGRTLDRLLLSICARSVPPFVDIVALYVLCSRVRAARGLRTLQPLSAADAARLQHLRHDPLLAAYEHAYGHDGKWSDDRARYGYAQALSARDAANARARGCAQPEPGDAGPSATAAPAPSRAAGKRPASSPSQPAQPRARHDPAQRRKRAAADNITHEPASRQRKRAGGAAV